MDLSYNIYIIYYTAYAVIHEGLMFVETCFMITTICFSLIPDAIFSYIRYDYTIYYYLQRIKNTIITVWKVASQ